MRQDEPEEEDDRSAGIIAVLSAAVFIASVLVMTLVHQIGGALTGEAATGAPTSIPLPAITTRQPTESDPAWLRHATPFAARDDKPVLSLVILDDGTQSDLAMNALDWDIPISIAVAADFDASPFRITQIQQRGGEALVLLPLGYADDFGRDPNVLRVGLTEEELLRRLHWHLARAGEGVVGVVDHREGDIRRDTTALRVLGDGLAEAQVMMIATDNSESDSPLSAVLRHREVPVGRSTAHLSRGDTPEAMRTALATAQRHAFAWGTAIVLIEAGEEPMAVVRDWLTTRGGSITLAPITHTIGRLRKG